MSKKIVITCVLLALSTAAQAQTCNPAKTPNTPDSRYTVQAGGAEVLDTQSGLIWQRCSLGQSWSGSTCTGEAKSYSWSIAMQTVRDLGNGWRLPNLKELLSLTTVGCTDLSINETLFPATVAGFSSFYWTSSPAGDSGDNGNYAWVVGFSYGSPQEGPKSANAYVRAVSSSK